MFTISPPEIHLNTDYIYVTDQKDLGSQLPNNRLCTILHQKLDVLFLVNKEKFDFF